MWRLLPISFAVAVAAVSALIFHSAADSITNKLCSDRPNSLNAPCSTGDGETAARSLGRHADAGGGNLVRLHNQVSYRVLPRGSESPL